ncbi:MAG: methyltransferase domain-containing protein [Gammaproteobacteria bacterium]|nr:methyltransferase domain-containing protein [Gammaproteobacteria bacterium]
MRIIFLAFLMLFLSACANTKQSESAAAESSKLEASVGSAQRPESEVARDVYRHPQETLEFFGLTPEISVVELWPGGGWYTKIIAPVVRGDGKYYAAHVDPNSKVEMLRLSVEKYQAFLDSAPELYDEVEMTVLMPPAQLEIAPAGSVDLVVSFRSIHNWMAFGMQDDVMKAVYDVLKPGGIFGVVEHRGIAGQPQDPKASTGYVTVDAMVEMAEKAGLQLESSSEINANPLDTKDYPAGVWSLPPRLKLGEEDRQKYLDIGESDRFTLRFVKPIE